MRIACALALGLAARQFPLSAPLDRMPIHRHRHNHLDKGGTWLAGLTCGADYARAVTGVPDAERDITACRDELIAGVATGLSTFAFEGVTVATDGEIQDVGVALTATAYVVSLVVLEIAMHHLDRAIDTYNAAIAQP